MAPSPIVETRGLSKSFAGYCAVDNVSLSIEAGTIHAIIGPNGAGKTTFFNLLSGFVKPTRGNDFACAEPTSPAWVRPASPGSGWCAVFKSTASSRT